MKNSKELIELTKKLSILFVEDHDELRKDISRILEKIKFSLM